MQSTLIPRPGDDPHDVVVVAPDAVRVAPADDELSSLLHQAARLRSDLQVRAGSGVPAGPAVPDVDTRFRPTAAGDSSTRCSRSCFNARTCFLVPSALSGVKLRALACVATDRSSLCIRRASGTPRSRRRYWSESSSSTSSTENRSMRRSFTGSSSCLTFQRIKHQLQ